MFPGTEVRIENIWNVSRSQISKSFAACLKLAVNLLHHFNIPRPSRTGLLSRNLQQNWAKALDIGVSESKKTSFLFQKF
jgi:hypothetical protein